MTGSASQGFGLAKALAHLKGCAASLCLVVSLSFSSTHLAQAFDDDAGSEDGCIRIANHSDSKSFENLEKGALKLYEAAVLCLGLRYIPVAHAHAPQLRGRFVVYLAKGEFPLASLDSDGFTFTKVNELKMYHVHSKDMSDVAKKLEPALTRLGGPAFIDSFLPSPSRARGL